MGVKVAGEEGYQVNLGGGSDQDQGLGRELIPAMKASELHPVMERLFTAFDAKKSQDESFLSFTRRHFIEDLRAYATTEELS